MKEDLARKKGQYLSPERLLSGKKKNYNPLKGTHARDFHSLFLNFSLHLPVTNRNKKQYVQPTFSKIFYKFGQIFKVFVRSLPAFAESTKHG
jgi:hypothetical protein